MNAFAVYPSSTPSAPREAALPRELSGGRVRRRLLVVIALAVAIAAIVTLLPGLTGLRTRLAHAQLAWLGLGVGLKMLSGLGYIAIFRVVFARELPWRRSFQIGISELGANALLPTGGAGGLALGAWALRRGGMPASDIARRTVAFFLLTSVANVLALALIGVGFATRVLPGETSPALTILPAAAATLAVVGALLAGRLAAALQRRLASRDTGPAARAGLALRVCAALADGVKDALELLREGSGLLIAGMVAYLFFDLLLLSTAFRAFGAAPHLGVVWIAYLIGELGGLLPVPGGIGGVDAGLIGALVLYHVPLTHASSAVLAYRAIALWVPALLAGPAFIALRRALRAEPPGDGFAGATISATAAHTQPPRHAPARRDSSLAAGGALTSV